MALREVIQFPDPRLKAVCEPIEEIDDAIRGLASDMLEVMYDEPGIGLAAPQVGESIRLIVVDTEWTEEGAEPNPLVLIKGSDHRAVWRTARRLAAAGEKLPAAIRVRVDVNPVDML